MFGVVAVSSAAADSVVPDTKHRDRGNSIAASKAGAMVPQHGRRSCRNFLFAPASADWCFLF